jgi:hypothetical protein
MSELRRHHQHGAAGLLQGVFQLIHPIAGVDVHQDRPDLAGMNWVIVHSARLGDQMPMRSPFAPKRYQSTAQRRPHLKPAIGITQPWWHDQRLRSVPGDDLIEHLANGAT